MKTCRLVLLLLTLTGVLPALSAEHTRLLPAPAELAYGDGTLPLRGLCAAALAGGASDEDRFNRGLLLEHGVKACAGRGTPVKLVRTGPVAPLPEPGESAGAGSREAYTLSIRREGVTIASSSSAGVFYGVQTLLQMVERDAAGVSLLPLAEVHDYPALAYRAILVDAGSEGPMLTVAEVKAQIDLLSRWKGNQFFFYSEGNIELKGYPLLNPRAQFSQAEIREIVTYARQRHVDVVPAIEMYGHLHDLFRIEKYATLADFPHGVEFDPNNPAVAAVVKEWAAQINDLFPSRFVDIGFDETWALSKAAEHVGSGAEPYQLFLKQLNLVSGEFESRGKTVLAWADIMVKFPAIVPRLPKHLIALPWCYEAEPDPEYHFWLDALVKDKVPYIAASGVHSWNEIAPDFSTTFRNIDTWIAAGKRTGSLGLLNTLWTDNGQMLMRMSWPGIAYGAAAAWQQPPMQPASFFAVYATHEYPADAAPQMAAALHELNQAEVALQGALGQRTMQEFWLDPFTPETLKAMRAKRETLRQARLHAEIAMEHLLEVKKAAPAAAGLESFLYGAQNIDLAGMKFLYAVELDDAWSSLPKKPTRAAFDGTLSQSYSNEAHSRAMDMMDGVSELQRVYGDAWRQQYTPYRMGTAMSRWTAELECWRRVQTNLEQFRMGFKTGDAMPPLQEVVNGPGR